MDHKKFSELQMWYLSGEVSKYIKENFCKTRSEFNGRLASYEKLITHEFSENYLYLISSSLGEIGNNCFDHNLGFWQDEVGCVFIREKKCVFICDRGRGVKRSLSRAYNLSKDDKNYLSVAFSKVVTGRAPEKRGNGLKFVSKNILSCGLGLVCRSGDEFFHLGISLDEIGQKLQASVQNNDGVLTYVYW